MFGGIIALRFEAHDLSTTLTTLSRAERATNGRTGRFNRLTRLAWLAKARHYRRSQMLDSAAVCRADAAKFPRSGDGR